MKPTEPVRSRPSMRWLALSLGAGVVLGGAGGWWAMRRQVTVEARRLAQLMVDGAVVRPPVPPAPAGVGRSADGVGAGQVPVIAISEDLAVAARALLAIRDPAVRQAALVRFLELLPQARWPEFLRSFEQLGHRGEFDDEPGSFMSALGSMEVIFAKMTARDPAGFLQQLLDVREEWGSSMSSVPTALRFWAAKDLTGAVAFFDQNLRSLPPADQAESAKGLAREWVRRDAASAFAWIKNLPEENRTSVAHGAFQTLSHVDSAAALRFLVTETALPGRSDFAYDMARGWTAAVSNQEQRLSALNQNVKAWVEYDPAAAREWVQSTPRLNDDDRARLLLLTRK